jgi:FMN phosphatase YigB (HAD superfamily)
MKVLFNTIIFDLDDTLINSTEIARGILTSFFAKNIELFPGHTADSVITVISQIHHDLVHKQHQSLPQANINVLFKLFESLKITPPSLKCIVELKTQIDRVFVDNTKPLPNAQSVISELKNRGMKIGVLTNNSFDQQGQKLIKTGLLDHINCLVTIEMLPAGKMTEDQASELIMKAREKWFE